MRIRVICEIRGPIKFTRMMCFFLEHESHESHESCKSLRSCWPYIAEYNSHTKITKFTKFCESLRSRCRLAECTHPRWMSSLKGDKSHSFVKLKLKGCKQHSSGKLKFSSSQTNACFALASQTKFAARRGQRQPTLLSRRR
jgi:hypothetical protein